MPGGRHRRRGDDPQSRYVQGLPRQTRRSARTLRRPGQADHRPGQAHLHVHRRTALLRDRSARDADGTGLPAGRGREPALRFHPQERDRHALRRGRARWARPLRGLVLQVQAGRGKRERSHPRPSLLGQVHLPRQQSRHQLLAGDHVQLVEVLPGMASADHARSARVGAVDVHLQRAIAAEPHARPDPLRRNAALRRFRNDQDDRLRHARRVDSRLRGYVVARLSRLHELQSQRHAAHV